MSRPEPLLCLNLYSTLGGAERALLALLGSLDRERYDPLVVLGCEGALRGGSAFQDRADFWRRFHEGRDLLICKHFRGGRRQLARLLHRFGIALHAAASQVAGRPEDARHLVAALRALTAGRASLTA